MAELKQIQFNGVVYDIVDEQAVHVSDVDTQLSPSSTNPVQNKAVYEAINNVQNAIPDGGVYYVAGTDSIASVTTSPYYASRWRGSNVKITSLYSGLTIAFKIDVAGDSKYGTLLNINNLGEHPVVRNISTMVGTAYGVGAIIVLTYDANQTSTAYTNTTAAQTITGCWKVADYDTDTTNTYQMRNYSGDMPVASGAGSLYRYQFCMVNMQNELVPFNNVSNKATTYTKAMNTAPFNPFGQIYYYNSTTTVAAGSNAAASTLFNHRASDVRYSLNIVNGGTAGTTALTASKSVYIRALYNEATHLATFVQDVSSSSYLERSSIIQTLPSAEEQASAGYKYIYIYFGQAYSTYQIETRFEHPVFFWNRETNSMDLFKGDLKLNMAQNADQTYTAEFYV